MNDYGIVDVGEELERLEQLKPKELERKRTAIGERDIDWFVYQKQKEALILDEQLGICTCLLDDEKKFCFSDGAVGPLNEKQKSLCQEIVEIPMPDEVKVVRDRSAKCPTDNMFEWGKCAIP